MWSGLSLDQQKDPLTVSKFKLFNSFPWNKSLFIKDLFTLFHLQARVNIASPSLRTVEKQTAEAPFTCEAEVQVGNIIYI